MSNISFTPITDGSTSAASQVNTPLSTIYDDYNGNITDANISASAAIAGSKLATNAVTGDKMATSAIYLGSATMTSTFTTATTGSLVDVTGATVTVTVPAGNRNVLLMFQNGSVKTSGAAGTVMTLALVESSTLLSVNAWNQQVTGDYMPVNVSAFISAPSAGSHTYKLQVQCASGTTSILAVNPAAAGGSTPTLIALLI